MAQGKTAAAKKRKPAKQPAKPAKRAKRAKPAEQPAKQPAEQPKSRPAFARLSALDFDHRYLYSLRTVQYRCGIRTHSLGVSSSVPT